MPVTTHAIDISCTGPSPSSTKVGSGDKVEFDNTTGALVIISIGTPGIFNPAPGSTISIASGGNQTLTVGNPRGGSTFSYADCGEELGTRNGTIDP